jgi:putative colanic acid biosynthesis UDP-glucose lipid carrier transferase
MQLLIKPNTSLFLWFHRLIDLVIPFLMLWVIVEFVLMYSWAERYSILGILGSLVLVMSSQIVGIYQNWRGRPFLNSIKLILKAWLLTWAALIVIAFLYKDAENFSRLATGLWAITTPLVLISYRLLVRLLLSKYRMQGYNTRKIAIIGAGKVGLHLAETLQANKWLGYEIIGFYDDNPAIKNQLPAQYTYLGEVCHSYHDAKANKFNEIYICLPLRAEERIKKLLDKLTNTTVVVKYIPDLFTFDLLHAQWTELKGIPIISVYDTPLNNSTARTLKRLEDIIVGLLILTLISPVLMVIALLVKSTSAGPVIFKQQRYGLNGKKINIYKFRSMTTQDNGATVKQATQNDIRITPLGAFLRRTSLDELPQFINVLQGNMSIVGPRPHAVAHNEEYRNLVPKYMQRHLVKPGITGWAQVNGWRGETDTAEKMEKRVEFDLHYIKSWSLWLDIKIIVLTIFKGFVNKNAY